MFSGGLGETFQVFLDGKFTRPKLMVITPWLVFLVFVF